MKVPISPDIKLDIMRLVETRMLIFCTLGLAARDKEGVRLNPEIQNL